MEPGNHLPSEDSQTATGLVEPATGNATIVVPVESPSRVADGDDGVPPMSPTPSNAIGSVPATAPQLVDPAMSRAKFDREIRNYRAMEAEYLRRGWLLVRAEYPEVVVLFAAPQLAPSPVVFGVVVDFTNYDFWAPSVRFVHPFTRAPLLFGDMPTHFWKRAPAAAGAHGIQQLLQHQADQVPFLCIKGVREYHDHPVHSNDPWLAYRGTGVGTLFHILHVIHRYGVAPFTQFGIQIRSIECAIGLGVPDRSNIPE